MRSKILSFLTEFWDNYKQNYVMSRYFHIIVLVMIIPFAIISIMAFSFYSDSAANSVINSDNMVLQQYKDKFMENYYNTYNINTSVINDDYIEEYMYYGDNVLNSREMFYNISLVIKSVLADHNVASVYIANFNTGYVCGSNMSGELETLYDREWYDAYRENESKDMVYARSFTNNQIGISDDYITYIYGYYIGSDVVGAVVINTYNDYNYGDGIIIGTANDKGVVIHCSDESRYGENISTWKEFEKIQPQLAKYSSGTYRRSNSAAMFSKLAETSFVSFIIDNEILSGNAYFKSLFTAFLAFLGMMLIALIIAYIISAKLYSMIANLLILLDSAEGGEQSGKLTKSEMLYIINTIVNNENSIDSVSYELSKKLIVLRKTQTIALQTQITPHFIYNTLQTINLVAMKLCKGDNDASKMIILFSRLLEAALDTGNYIVPLKTELEYAMQYLSIQEYKYKGKFTVVYDMPEEIPENIKVIKLCMQPVLENALHHGIGQSSGNNEIIIRLVLNQDSFDLAISNNGKPISEAAAREINERFKKVETIKESKSIGLANVNHRIKLVFGDKYGCCIYPENGYTVVKMTFPYYK